MLKLYHKVLLFLLIALLLSVYSSAQQKPLRWLGDISFDKKLDKADFQICNGEANIFQYFNKGFNIAFEGDKPALIALFKENYDPSIVKPESGLIRIRFIVNCNRETDRFRLLEGGLDYQKKTFDKVITDQLLSITKSITGWKQKFDDDGNAVDYYQYLIFRIVNGQITKLLP